MTEETLKDLSIDGLFDLLLLNTKELLEAIEKKNETDVRVKTNQVELLQRIIVTKKAESARK